MVFSILTLVQNVTMHVCLCGQSRRYQGSLVARTRYNPDGLMRHVKFSLGLKYPRWCPSNTSVKLYPDGLVSPTSLRDQVALYG